MKIVFRIWVGLVCLCWCAIAQTKYDPHYVSQEVQYDDEPSHSGHQNKYYQVRQHPAKTYENHDEYNRPQYGKPAGSPYVQISRPQNNQPYRYYAPKKDEEDYPKLKDHQLKHTSYGKPKNPYESHEEYKKHEYPKYETIQYDSQGLRTPNSEQNEELQYSHEPEYPSHHQNASPKSTHPQYIRDPQHSSYHQHESPGPQYSHEPERSSHYQPESPHYETSQPSLPQYSHELEKPPHYQREPPQHESSESPHSQYSHEPDRSVHYERESPSSGHVQDSHEAEYPSYEQPEAPKSTHSVPPTAQRDPKLPLYFTMYEKRIIQDPVDKYGKGPWRYLTYGHGITYGSKEPGKVFERGYGYIRALGRDHCKLPDKFCPPHDEKPFDYEGRKEPYFGYRPH